MRKLSIEEKAKAYDEAIERAKFYKENTDSVGAKDVSAVIEGIFPELKESEDENIRKAIIEFIKISKPEWENYSDYSAWIAWLEKQGEHANFCDKIQIGDKVTRNEYGVLVNLSQLNRVAKKNENQGEQKPADNVEPKFKVGDKVINGGKVCTIKIVNEDNYIVNNGKRDIQVHFSYTKDWELVKQKPAWSEEDELIVSSIITDIEYAKRTHSNISSLYYDREIAWLKALRHQPHWKPSEEQMADLWNMMCESRPEDHQLLQDIYYGLKSLKGEQSYESKRTREDIYNTKRF